jgi:hypothetical protein
MATYTVKSGDGKETLGSFKSMAEAESFMSGEGYSSFSIDDRREGGGRTSGVSIGGGEDALRSIRSGDGDGGIKSIRTNYSGMPFSKAFSSARSTLGPGQTFQWNGKQYSTATAEERPDLARRESQAQDAFLSSVPSARDTYGLSLGDSIFGLPFSLGADSIYASTPAPAPAPAPVPAPAPTLPTAPTPLSYQDIAEAAFAVPGSESGVPRSIASRPVQPRAGRDYLNEPYLGGSDYKNPPARSTYDEIPAELNRLTIQPPEPIFANLPAQADIPSQPSAYQAAVDGALQFLGFRHTPEKIQENLSGAGDRFFAGMSGEPFSLSRFAPSKEFIGTFLYGPQPEPDYFPPADANMVGSYDRDAVAAGGAAGFRPSYNMPSPGIGPTAAYEPISSAPTAITDADIKAYREQTGSSLRDDTIRQILEGQQLEDRITAAQAASEKASSTPSTPYTSIMPTGGPGTFAPGGLPPYATGTSGLGDYRMYGDAYEEVKGLSDYMADAQEMYPGDPVKQREMGQYMFDQAAPYSARRREDAARGEYVASMAMAPTAPVGGILSLKDVVNSGASGVPPVYNPPQEEDFSSGSNPYLTERGTLPASQNRVSNRMLRGIAALEEQRQQEAPTISTRGFLTPVVDPNANYASDSLEAARRSMPEILGSLFAPRRSLRPRFESRRGM